MAITVNGAPSFPNTALSADLAATITDESGTGALVFNTSPTLVTPALGTPSSATLTNATGLPVSGITASTSTALGVGTVELGHATDTTLARVSAGVVSIEGVNVVTRTSTDTLTNKTLTSPVLGGTTSTASGNLAVLPATYILEVQGGASTEGAIQLNCAVNSHGQKVKSQPHAQAASNTLLLPGGTTIGNSDAVLVSDTGTQTLTNKTLTDAKINLAINAQTGTTYTFVLTDNGKFVTASNASAITVTIPPISSVAYPTGAQINIIQKGAGQVTFAQGSGVTIRSTGATATAPKLRAQYSSATCIHEGSDVWYVVGDIS